jgi:glucose/arabinose dehydrogenase
MTEKAMWRAIVQTVPMLLSLLAGTASCGNAVDKLHLIKLPPGFVIDIYTDQVPGARSLAVSPAGILFVATRKEGKVYAVLDKDHDYRAEQVITVAQGLNMPNGVAFKDGALFVAEVHRILRFDNIEDRLSNPGPTVVVYDKLPRDRLHGWKFIRFGPDNKLYVPIGAPCNSCDRGDPYAAIHRMNPDGSGFEIFARGVRNTVGFDWHPVTKELWFTDNGRDWLGDDRPPDELNRASGPGLHFGYPFLHGKDIPEPEFGAGLDRSLITLPAMELGPHVASLGMRFYTGSMFPEEYRNQILIAEHGSWNRSVPIGYRISLVRLQGDKVISYETFATGWLQGSRAWGRPVDVQVLADGSLLVSDDKAGAIYRIHYSKSQTEN